MNKMNEDLIIKRVSLICTLLFSVIIMVMVPFLTPVVIIIAICILFYRQEKIIKQLKEIEDMRSHEKSSEDDKQ